MKNILLENMLRFGTKNLSEKTRRTLQKLAEQKPALANAAALKNKTATDQTAGTRLTKQPVTANLNYAAAADTKLNPTAGDYNKYKDEMWIIPYSNLIVHQVPRHEKNSFAYYYQTEPNQYRSVYPMWKNLKVPAEWVAQSKQEFDSEFIKRYKILLNDRNWLLYIANQFNILFKTNVKTPSAVVKNIQSYIKTQIQDKTLVKDNGTPGQAFEDGVWGVISTKAWLTHAIQTISPFNTIQQIVIQRATKSTNNTTKEPYGSKI